MSQQAESGSVRLAQPGAGSTVSVPIDTSTMRLNLDFIPDPNAVEKNGQNLEFSFEDGGKLVLEGYYDHFASKTLPVMVTESGEELPGEDFLAALREDLLTAAGPGAGAGAGAVGSGAGEYTDDAGTLVAGISRLRSLGSMQWDRATEAPELIPNGLAAAPAPPLVPAISITPALPDEGLPSELGYAVSVSGVSFTLNEAYLNIPGGSQGTMAGEGPISCIVQFLITTNDGLASVTVGGVTYALNPDGTLSGFPADGIADAGGVGSGLLGNPMVVPQADGTYLLSFTYSLTGAHSHEPVQGANIATDLDNFTISVSSINGSTSTEVTASVNLIDDIPAFFEQEAILVVEENWSHAADGVRAAEGDIRINFGADGPHAETPFIWTIPENADEILGLDGKPVEWVIDGTLMYCTNATTGDTLLVIMAHNVEGPSPSYTVAVTGPLKHPLGSEGEAGKDALDIILNFQIMDGDGDTTMGFVKLKVLDSVPEINYTGEVTVSESALTPEGTGRDWDADGVNAATATGYFTVQSFDGVRGIYIDGTGEVPFGTPVELGPGTLVFQIESTVNGIVTVTYTYELTGNADHTYGDGTHLPTLAGGALTLPFKVVDGDGDRSSGTATITINIVDDMPVVPENPITEDTFGDFTHGEATVYGVEGTFEGFAFGADGPLETDAIWVNDTPISTDGDTDILFGQYGALYVSWNAANGAFDYIYVVDAAKLATADTTQGPPTESFEFALTDGDGDTASQFLKINLGDAVIFEGDGGILKVDESRLPDIGSQVGGSLTATSGDAETIPIIAGGKGFLNDITVNGDAVLFTDSGSDTWTATVKDGGTYGSVTLTVTQTGDTTYELSYTYTLTSAPNVEGEGRNEAVGQDGFTIGYAGKTVDVRVDIMDDIPRFSLGGETSVTDGDSSDNTGVIAFVFGADGPSATAPFAWDVDALNAMDDADACKTWTADGGTIKLTWEVDSDGLTLTGYGENNEPVITVNAQLEYTNGVIRGASYTVALHKALVHPTPGEHGTDGKDHTTLPLELPFTLTDGDGDSVAGFTTVNVADSVPMMADLTLPTPDEGDTLLPGGTASGEIVVDPGQDGLDWDTFTINGIRVIFGAPMDINGAKFSFVLDATTSTVTYTYTAGEKPGEPEYTFAVKDRDGDPTSKSLTLSVSTPPPTITWVTAFTGAVDESMLPNSVEALAGTKMNQGSLTTDGVVKVSSYTGLSSLTINGKPIDLSGWDPADPDFEYSALAKVLVDNGEVTITGITLTPGTPATYTVNLTYTLTSSSQDHGQNPMGGESLDEASMPTFAINALDEDGLASKAPLTAAIDVLDDAPASVTPEATDVNTSAVEASLGGLWGADGISDTHGATFEPKAADSVEGFGYKTGMTSDGKPIFYTISDSGTNVDSVLTARYHDGTEWQTVFTVTLDAANNTYAVDMTGKVDLVKTSEPDRVTSGKGLGNDNVIWLTANGIENKSEPAAEALWATMTCSSAFNGNTHGIGVGNGPSFDPGEWIRFDFAKPQSIVSLGLSNGLSGTWTAYAEDGTTIVAEGTFTNVNGMLDIDANGAIFHNMTVEISNGSGQFTMINLNTQLEDLNPHLDVPIQIMDGDGDTVNGALALNFTADEGDPMLPGSTGGGILNGDSDNDILFGQTGDHTILGGADDGLISGIRDSDALWTDSGMDSFTWMAGDLDGGIDTIVDFQFGHDRLRFDSLLGNGDLNLEQMLAQDTFEALATDSGLTLTIKDGSNTLTVDIRFEGDSPIPDATVFNESSVEAQALLLQQMIITTSGG